MIGKAKRQCPKTKIVAVDEEGWVIDLHAMRTTLGTKLAQAGVATQLASASCATATTTHAKHYTVLDLTDTSLAIQHEQTTLHSKDQNHCVLLKFAAITTAMLDSFRGARGALGVDATNKPRRPGLA